MHTTGEYIGAQRTLKGDLVISFKIDNDEQMIESLDKLKCKKVIIDAKKWSDKRTLTANAYFWKLCDLIADKLGSTKDEIYLLQLSRYGFWLDKAVHKEAIPEIKEMFRYVEEFDDEWTSIEEDSEGNWHEATMQTIRCYIGSSHYSKREMARLIDGTVQDAKELGVDTWSQEEIERLVAEWQAR